VARHPPGARIGAQVASIPTGIDFSRLVTQRARAEVRAELGLGADHFVGLMVGAIRGIKRDEVVLRAFATVAGIRAESGS
jgi:hypothetical protein